MERIQEEKWHLWRKLSVVLGILLAFELGGFVKLFAAHPELPINEYHYATQEQEQVETEIHRLNLQRVENQHPLEAMSTLLTFKPQNVNFVKVSIGDLGDGDYVHMDLRAQNREAVQNYIDSLAAYEPFREIHITEIKQNATGVTAQVVVPKGAEKE